MKDSPLERGARHQPGSESRLMVYAAIAGNVAIAIAKFAGAAATGSAAMLSEGIHSTVDTGNGALLLLGLRLSRRPVGQSFLLDPRLEQRRVRGLADHDFRLRALLS